MAIDYEDFMSREAKWAEVDLDALAFNIRSIREKTGPDKRICAVIKANAYGHGALVCAKTLLENGADQFAVAVMNEALELRSAFPEQDILVLGNLPYGTEKTSINADLQHTVTSIEKARLLSETAVHLGKTARIHIKVDSGMTRLGSRLESQLQLSYVFCVGTSRPLQICLSLRSFDPLCSLLTAAR